MRPGDRTIRHELRREAAQIPIPDTMWEKIDQQLDLDHVRAERRKQLALRTAQWKPALALAAAAGIFWLTVVPPRPSVDTPAQHQPVALAATPVRGQDLSVRAHMEARREMERRNREETGGGLESTRPFLYYAGPTAR